MISEAAAEGLWLGAAGAAGGLLFAALASQAIIEYLMRDYVVRTSLNTAPDPTIIGVALVTNIAIAVGVSITAVAGATRHPALTTGSARTVARSSRPGRILVGAQIAASTL